MEEFVVRPSIKLLKTAYGVAIFTLLCLVGAKLANLLAPFGAYWWICFLPPLIYLGWIVAKHVSLRLTQLVVNADRVRFESGLLSKQMRSIDVAKVHDVRVTQSVRQRVTGMGDLTIETAGASMSVHMVDIDDPQQIADRILQFSRKAIQQRVNTTGA